MKLDAYVMGVKARASLINNLLARTGLDSSRIILDDRGFKGGGNCWYTCKKVWTQPVPEGVTHRLLLQDDVLVVDDFISICEKIIDVFPDVIWSLNGGVWIKPEMKKTDSPYINIRGCKTSGEAFIIPVQHIKPMLEWSDAIFGEDYIHDMSRVGYYALYHGIPMYGTIPSLTYHQQIQSMIPKHNRRDRVTHAWMGEHIGLQNWENKNVNQSPFMISNIWYKKNMSTERKRIIEDMVETAKRRFLEMEAGAKS